MTERYKNKYRIKSSRLQSWDYGRDGVYFITICTKNRKCYFGAINNGKMIYSEIGRIAYAYWVEIPNHFPFVGLDKFIIMPNHVHGIIIIDKSNINVETLHPGVETLQCNVSTVKKNKFMSKISPKPGSISTIVRSYKSVVSKHAHKICIDFNWQPRFYDRIIRNDREFYNIQQYILHNSTQWEGDRNYQD